MKRWVIGLLALMMAGPAPAQEAPGRDAALARLVDRAVDRYILPAYRDLRASTAELAAATADYCKDGDDRAAVEAAFAGVHEDWSSVDFLRFGPMADGGRLERFYFWPDPRGIGERQLRTLLNAADPALLDPVELARQSAAVQGLAAFERIFYDADRLVDAPNAEGRYRCEFALAIAGNLSTIASDVYDGWDRDGGWADLMREPGGSPPVYLTHSEAVNELLKALLTGLEQLKDQRIAVPLGATPEEARVTRAPFHRSGLTFDYWRDTIAALAEFAAVADFASLAAGDANRWMANSAAFETRQIERALDDLGPSLEAALTQPEGRDRLTYVITALASLRTTYGVQMASAAGLSPGFNALDGD
jgi:predicted lipoprotein